MNTKVEPSMTQLAKDSLKRVLPNAQALALAVIVLVVFLLIYFLADLLMPVFASIVLAYLLDGLVVKARKYKIPRLPAVYLVFTGFMACLGFFLFVLMPMITDQAIQLVQRFPAILQRLQMEVLRLPELYPKFFSESGIQNAVTAIQTELLTYGQNVLSLSAASVVGIVSAMIYLFLVPMMVFFLLKDKPTLLNWLGQFMPRDRLLTERVWLEVDTQLGNYVRGKFAEILVLWLASYITFFAMGLNYAMLLSVLMGVSVIIPYVGATLVTFPVVAVAFFQWGLEGDQFMVLMIAYAIIQAIDGVVLVPLLFSEAVNLHPIAIIVAILLFGGLWGFWGVFFAIPLATVVKALLSAWPRIGDVVKQVG
ncbi:MAG: AI-2E family transporter [Methylococcaceae bacterium]|nr:AI-2E family transporter [Methylococcaceae bacterium]